MRKVFLFLFGLMIAASWGNSLAQVASNPGTLTLTASPTTSKGSVAATLTWSTTPNPSGIAASSCVASGGWSGNLAASGSQTVALTKVTTTYSITCTWNDTNSSLSWVNPTQDSSGNTLTDLLSNNVYVSTTSTGPWVLVKNVSPLSTIYVASGQTVGTNYYQVTAVSTSEGEGSPSPVVSKVNGPVTASTTTIVTVIAVPLGPNSLIVK